MLTDLLDYDLPPALIATEPATPRDAARLLVINRATGQVRHQHIRDLPELGIFQPGDLMVFNQSKVVPAYISLTRTATGGSVTGLYLATTQPGQWSVMLEAGGKLREGEWLHFDPVASLGAKLQLTQRQDNGRWLVDVHASLADMDLLDRVGSPPLPPYIRKQRQTLHLPALSPGDQDRYNTVYAMDKGSVAAPTAGLHFTQDLLKRLDDIGVHRAMVTLHVGLGTFAPIRTACVEDHPIHSESCTIPVSTLDAIAAARKRGSRIIPIGTTTVRALESLPNPTPPASSGDFATQTNLYITPGEGDRPDFQFRFTDLLMTNFHLPRSSLLALVAALPGVGVDNLKKWYTQAIQEQYRFYSYGDAMLLA